jgi:hypothetical protein
MLSYVKYLAELAYNLALSAIQSIGENIRYVISLIVSYADYAYSRAVSYISSWISTFNYLIDVAWINRTVSPIWIRIQEVIGWVGEQIRRTIDAVTGPLWGVISPIWEWFKQWWSAIVDGIRWVFQTGLGLPGQLSTLWDYVNNTVVPNINKFINDTVPTLATVITNPWGFIFPYLKDYLWELLQYIIAYEMGTEKYSLPPWPTFNFTGAGGAMAYSESMQLDNSNLHRPLDHLYISGYRFSSSHPGLDLGLTNGTPIYAMHDGVVDVAAYGSTGYAVQVVIRGSKWWSRYAHCMQLLVDRNDTVHAGQLIALGDSTGNSTGPHLHLEIKYNGAFIDPVSVLPL